MGGLQRLAVIGERTLLLLLLFFWFCFVLVLSGCCQFKLMLTYGKCLLLFINFFTGSWLIKKKISLFKGART